MAVAIRAFIATILPLKLQNMTTFSTKVKMFDRISPQKKLYFHILCNIISQNSIKRPTTTDNIQKEQGLKERKRQWPIL